LQNIFNSTEAQLDFCAQTANMPRGICV